MPIVTRCRIALLMLLLLFSQAAYAQDEEKPENRKFAQTTTGGILLIEGAAIFNSYLASLNPHAYGGACALLSPLALTNPKAGPVTLWTGFASFEGLAVYNLLLHEDKYSKGEIFRNNMIGWHIFGAALATAGYLSGEFKENKRVAASYAPMRNGGLVQLTLKY